VVLGLVALSRVVALYLLALEARALLHAALLESVLAQGHPHVAAQLLLARERAQLLLARERAQLLLARALQLLAREGVQEVLVLVPLAQSTLK
jgi:hypothetical protein